MGEACLLAAVGCLLGLGAGWFAVSSLQQIDPSLLPRAYEVGFTPTLVLWAIGVSLGAVLVFATLPAWAATRSTQTQLATTRATDRRTRRLSGRLGAAQVALVIPLLVASSMQLRSVRALSEVETGFDVESTLVAGAALPVSQFGSMQPTINPNHGFALVGECLCGISIDS
jgi:predicted lysophospholipase L1 biosynthesis ABC-type transport system permease subunit